MLCQFLTIDIKKCKIILLACLSRWCLVVTLGKDNTANIDHLSWTINAAVGINIDMFQEFVVVVVISTPTQTFPVESIVLTFRELYINIVPLALKSNLSNAALVGHLFFEQSVFLLFLLIETYLHTLLRFATYHVRHHHSFLFVGHSNRHKGEG